MPCDENQKEKERPYGFSFSFCMGDVLSIGEGCVCEAHACVSTEGCEYLVISIGEGCGDACVSTINVV